MNCAITSANNFSVQSVVISRFSPVQSTVSVKKVTLNRSFICPCGLTELRYSDFEPESCLYALSPRFDGAAGWIYPDQRNTDFARSQIQDREAGFRIPIATQRSLLIEEEGQLCF